MAEIQKTIRIEVSNSDHKRIRLLAADAEVSIRAYVTALLLRALEEQRKEPERAV